MKEGIYMARVHSDFIKNYPSMREEDIQKPIIFVIDMINGFVEEGALHDKAIDFITPCIERLINEINCRTIFIADAHDEHAREFQSYPKHCIKGTSESDVIHTLKPYVKELFYKNSTNAFHSKQFQRFLNDIDAYQDIIITGCCSDICILQFALSLQSWLNEHAKLQNRIIIPIDCIDTYHIDMHHDAICENEFSIRNMQANAIMMVKEIKRGQ